jgi:hypothetical protein
MSSESEQLFIERGRRKWSRETKVAKTVMNTSNETSSSAI